MGTLSDINRAAVTGAGYAHLRDALLQMIAGISQRLDAFETYLMDIRRAAEGIKEQPFQPALPTKETQNGHS